MLKKRRNVGTREGGRETENCLEAIPTEDARIRLEATWDGPGSFGILLAKS